MILSISQQRMIHTSNEMLIDCDIGPIELSRAFSAPITLSNNNNNNKSETKQKNNNNKKLDS